MIGVGE